MGGYIPAVYIVYCEVNISYLSYVLIVLYESVLVCIRMYIFMYIKMINNVLYIVFVFI